MVLMMLATTFSAACDWAFESEVISGSTVAADAAVMVSSFESIAPQVILTTATGDVDLTADITRYCGPNEPYACVDVMPLAGATDGDTVTVIYPSTYYDDLDPITVTAPSPINGPQTPVITLDQVERSERQDSCYTGPDVTISITVDIPSVEPGSILVATETSSGTTAAVWTDVDTQMVTDIYLQSDVVDCYTLSVIGPNGARGPESNGVCSHVDVDQKAEPGCNTVASAGWMGWLSLLLIAGRRRRVRLA